MIKVAIIGTNGIPARYGGFETLAEYLSQYLSEDYDVYCYCAKTPKSKRIAEHLNAKLIYLPFKANGIQSIIYDAVSIVNSYIKHDLLIILGFSGIFAFPLKVFFGKKVIFNIGGIEWKKVRGSRWTGRIEILIKKFFEFICIKFSDVVITDNVFLYDYVKNRYNVISILAEYGGDHAIKRPIEKNLIGTYSFLEGDYDISLARAQEDMNIHILLDAYRSISERNLVIISNWNSSDYGRRLKKEYFGKYHNIYLLDAVYDLNLLDIFRGNACIYIHTHSLCGTAPSLVEAMTLGLPVISFDVPTNRYTTEAAALYFQDSESLKQILRNLTELDLNRLSFSMLEIALRRYNWKRIVGLYEKALKK